jgi:hypothetical protein
MAVRDAFKITRKTFFNPRAWFNYDEFNNQNNVLWNLLKANLVPPQTQPQDTQTFEQAMQRHGMAETDIPVAIKNYRLFALLFSLLAFLAFVYAFFILFGYHTLFGWLLSMCVCALLLAQALKYDFWSLQLRRRKLDLTFADWKASILGKTGCVA